jgi:hypothetical protein
VALTAAQNTGSQTVTTTTETAAANTAALAFAPPNNYGGMIVRGSVNITPGTGTTAVVVRVRQGNGTGGALVGNALTITAIAASPLVLPFSVLDPSATPASQYTVTVAQTAATANGTINQAEIETDPVLS